MAYGQMVQFNTQEPEVIVATQLQAKPGIISEKSLNRTERSLDHTKGDSFLNKEYQQEMLFHNPITNASSQNA